MRVPKLNLKKAIIAYHTAADLSNADIVDLFDGQIAVNSRSLQNLKRGAMELHKETNRPIFHDYCVNTIDFFDSMGLKIEDLEKKYGRLKKLGLIDEGDA